MCDHKWILLTTSELEAAAGYEPEASWYTRVCEVCKQVQTKKLNSSSEWIEWDDARSFEDEFITTPLTINWLRRLRLAAVGR